MDAVFYCYPCNKWLVGKVDVEHKCIHCDGPARQVTEPTTTAKALKWAKEHLDAES